MARIVHISRSILYAVVLSLAPSLADAQPATQTVADLTGIVVDASGGRIANATIIVSSAQSAFLRVIEGSDRGQFTAANLAPGQYAIAAVAPGFAVADLIVSVPSPAALEIVLVPAPVIEEVRVVSASRQDELRARLNTRVDVISRARIDDSGAQTVGEALRDLPGVVTRRGSEGAGAAGQQIQGIDSKQVLVLLDGVPIVGARGVKRGGAINLDRQSTARLDRIEVVKGAASTLYGSDAIGGVINLITADAAAPLQLGGTIAGGSRGDMNALAEIGFHSATWSALFNAERHQSDGFDLTPSTFDTTAAPFRRVDAFAKLRWSPSSRFGLHGVVTGYRNRTTGRSNGELGPQEDNILERTFNGIATADWLATPSTSVQLRASSAGFDEDAAARLAPPVGTVLDPGELTQHLTRVDASVSQIVGARQHVQGGVEYQSDEYSGINRLRNDSGESASTAVAWAQHRLALGSRITTTAGVRIDQHSQFGQAISPKFGANAQVLDGLFVRASIGRGFRAPDIGQLYYRFLNPTNFYQVIGNPNLTPERAHSLQLGAEYQAGNRRARAGVNLFRNDVRDLIDSVSLGFVATPAQLQSVLIRENLDSSFRPALGRLLFTYKNISDARTQGVEVDAEAALSKTLTVAGAYTYLDARDNVTDLELTGRHRHHGHARVAWQLDRVGLRANLRATVFSSWIAARSTTGGIVDTRAPGFALLDAYVAQRLGRDLTAFLAVDNLANSRDPNTGVISGAAPAPIYRPEAGRSVRFGLRWKWSQQ